MNFEKWGVGGILALLVLIFAVVFMATGHLTLIVGVLVAVLALARML